MRPTSLIGGFSTPRWRSSARRATRDRVPRASRPAPSVNQQLIAYHFGGKQGLLEELRKQWSDLERGLRGEDGGFGESIRGYVDATLDNPDWARLAVWQALGDGPADDELADSAPNAITPAADLDQALDRIRARQQSGELAEDLDPKFVLLLSYLIAFAPIALPSIVAGIYGVDPLSPTYRREVMSQLLDAVSPRADNSM